MARKLRSSLTEAEGRLWSRLRRKQIDGQRFRRQAPIGAYVVDFVCFEAKLIIEVDGGQHADSKTDVVRTAFFEAQGYRLLRFWNNDVLANTDGVIEVVRATLAGYPPPRPSPTRGEGD